MKYTRCLQWQRRAIVVLTCVLAMAAASDAIAQKAAVPTTIGTRGRVYLPAIGGGGGVQFFAPCPAQQNLVGFEMRVGDDVDAISPVCAKSIGPTDISDLHLSTNQGLVGGGSQPNEPNGDLFAEQITAPGWHGGPGGGLLRLLCPADTPIVIGLDVAAQGQRTVVVHNIHMFCGRAVAAQSAAPNPSAVFDGNGSEHPHLLSQSERCPAGQVAVGMHGRSGVWLDAMGLICDAPTVWNAPEPTKLVGRTKVPTTPGPPRAICDLAREARARNSPAADGLEAQCRAAGAAGEKPPVKAVPRIKGSSSADAPPISICEAAREARARNSPAAPGLEASCLNGLAATGEAIAQADEIVAAARAAETDAQYRQGFDIATGIFGDPAQGAQGNTAMGPGSQKIRDSLSAAGQRGFDASVKLHLSRNYQTLRDSLLFGLSKSRCDVRVDCSRLRARAASPQEDGVKHIETYETYELENTEAEFCLSRVAVARRIGEEGHCTGRPDKDRLELTCRQRRGPCERRSPGDRTSQSTTG